jgi:hypothetical protein
MSQYFGAHAYLLTRKGAQVLLQYSFPIDHQVDGLFLTLQQMGLLRVHMASQSLVKQCMDHVDRAGSWHTHRVAETQVITAQSFPVWGREQCCVHPRSTAHRRHRFQFCVGWIPVDVLDMDTGDAGVFGCDDGRVDRLHEEDTPTT